MALGKNMANRRKELGMTMRELAEKLGLSHSAINNMEKRDVKTSQHIEKIAEALDTTPQWLSGVSNVSPAHNIIFSEIPVIEKNTAKTFTNSQNLQSHEIETWLMAPKDYKGRAFGLRLEGDSMTAPTGKSYPHGSIAVFDSGNKMPENGELVFAQIEGTDEVTFKKYTTDAGNRYLMPLNPYYPHIDKPFTVLAVFEYAVIY